ncbi:helix-turn-helix transcriptional regulator [Streptomyces sp. RFCAC02]|uniref:helix-turn-helix domain-containing protein n=1 Tax=Streptomyces sp. RFCAC02 TaxID=2499143 RepID=UPI00101F5975|nr:helix-turn-helix transcriptional regulator [Streptomyces sp. RFCAC02]
MASTFRSRRLGAELRQLREDTGLSAEAVAKQMEFSRPKLSRIEAGEVRVSQNDLKALLHLYGVDDDARRTRFIESARDARKRGWWQTYADSLPREYTDYIALEADATDIRTFQPILIPGLLQTERYMRAAIRANPAIMPPADVDKLVRIRFERQTILGRDQPPRLWAILGEAALRQTVGGADVMVEQIRHLEKLTASQHIVIQVLPYSAGAHAGLTGPFVCFSLPRDPDIVCVENMTGTLYMDRAGERQGYNSAFDHLRAAADNPADSLVRMQGVAEEMQKYWKDTR